MFSKPSLHFTLCGALALLLLCWSLTATAQTTTATAAATGEGVRFTVLGETAALRLELFAPGGERVFDSGFTPGGVMDWTPINSKQPLAEGAYLCVLTSKDLSGRLSQRIGLVAWQEKGVAVRAADETQLDAGQQAALAASRKEQSIEATQSLTPLTIIAPNETPAVTVATHDGKDGAVVSTTGALSLRTGDILSGREREGMRLTTDGKVGIGTDQPEATLDVAGTIRARQGVQFADGSTLNLAPTGGLRITLPSGETAPVNLAPNAVAGTAHHIPKFDTNGTSLVDSALYQDPNNGFIGWRTTSPAHPFTVRRNGGTLGVHSFGELFVDRDNRTRSASMILGTGGVLKWIFGMPYQDDGFQVFDLLASPAPGLSRFYVHPTNGNVGIGTNSPAHKLDVTGSVNAQTDYRLNGNRVLAVSGGLGPNSNTFVGVEAGAATTPSGGVPSGNYNSFFGNQAGKANTTGSANSFFGLQAGFSNTTGRENSFFGWGAGVFNTTGAFNSFFGMTAGYSNTEGFDNSFFGWGAGDSNTTGGDNSFFGDAAGGSNTTGNNNTIIGADADVGSNNLSYATAIGSNAVVSTSNTIALGRSSGSDKVRVFGLGTAGATALCRNADNELSTCSSSLRYKREVNPFVGGLNLIRKLRPITFRWNTDGTTDVGFGAEDVARVAPLFVTRNAAGEIEGVKYGQLSTVLVNAVQEQQSQIAAQQAQLKRQQREIQARDERINHLEARLAQLERVMLSPRRPATARPRQKRR